MVISMSTIGNCWSGFGDVFVLGHVRRMAHSAQTLYVAPVSLHRCIPSSSTLRPMALHQKYCLAIFSGSRVWCFFIRTKMSSLRAPHITCGAFFAVVTILCFQCLPPVARARGQCSPDRPIQTPVPFWRNQGCHPDLSRFWRAG